MEVLFPSDMPENNEEDKFFKNVENSNPTEVQEQEFIQPEKTLPKKTKKKKN
jgi:hypothetical protein